mmetsp:Transcript_174120/g.558301  ORF Transcript_174120/g.558301 Transcript_174120/m.558301 type:complete len:206 (+) Transcript_174120:682-1299(+)
MPRRLRRLRRVVAAVQISVEDGVPPIDAVTELAGARCEVQWPWLEDRRRNGVEVYQLPRELALAARDVQHTGALPQHFHAARVQQPAAHHRRPAVVLDAVAAAVAPVGDLRVRIRLSGQGAALRFDADGRRMLEEASNPVLALAGPGEVLADGDRRRRASLTHAHRARPMQPLQTGPAAPSCTLLDWVDHLARLDVAPAAGATRQ